MRAACGMKLQGFTQESEVQFSNLGFHGDYQSIGFSVIYKLFHLGVSASLHLVGWLCLLL